MRMCLFIAAFICQFPVCAQVYQEDLETGAIASFEIPPGNVNMPTGTIYPIKQVRWKMSRNKAITGGLMYLAGAAKGFNEGLQYHYKGFAKIFPRANKQWFYPGISFRNKYKDGDPKKGAKFPLSTSILVMTTDQYHLNNFIQRASITGALVIKIGEGKKPFRYYLFDILYYSVCYQMGFHSVYTPIRLKNGKKL